MMGSEVSSLGDQLHRKVEEQLEGTDRQFIGNITGMMLELEHTKIEQLLKSPDLLQSAIRKSLMVCYERRQDNDSGKSGNNDSYTADENAEGKHRLGDLLFIEVERICPNDAAKVTGMLLELEFSVINQLLSSPQLLHSAVHKALTACGGSSTGDTVAAEDRCADGDCNMDRVDRLGDLLYDKVHKIYPDEAPKLTGMLLEQDLKYVHRLLEEDQLFYQCIHKARQAIKGDN